MPYKIVEHTADLALYLTGENLTELARSAVLGYVALLVDSELVLASETRNFKIIQDNPEGMLVSLINELIFLFETEDFIPHHAEINISGVTLSCKVFGETFNSKKHEIFHCIKSATYGGLKVKNVDGVFSALMILDD